MTTTLRTIIGATAITMILSGLAGNALASAPPERPGWLSCECVIRPVCHEVDPAYGDLPYREIRESPHLCECKCANDDPKP